MPRKTIDGRGFQFISANIVHETHFVEQRHAGENRSRIIDPDTGVELTDRERSILASTDRNPSITGGSGRVRPR